MNLQMLMHAALAKLLVLTKAKSIFLTMNFVPIRLVNFICPCSFVRQVNSFHFERTAQYHCAPG